MLIFPKKGTFWGLPCPGPGTSRCGKNCRAGKCPGPGPGRGPCRPAEIFWKFFSWGFFRKKISSFLTLWMAVADRYQKSARFAWSESFFTHLRPRSLRGIPFARYNIYRAPRNRALPRHASARPDFLYLAISAGRGVYHCLGGQGGPANLRPNPMW